MSVLDTFLVLFELDATNVEKGSKKAREESKKLVDELSTVDVVGKKIGGTFKDFITHIGGSLAAIASVGAVFAGLHSSKEFADHLGELSESLNVNIEDLSAWGDAVQMSGGTAEDFQNTVKTMTAGLSSFATKGHSLAAPFFEELGIKMVDARGKARSFLDLLPEIAGAFEKVSKTESFGIGQKMGLDRGTIMLLQTGRVAVEDLLKRQRELGVITAQDAEAAGKFNDAWDDTTHLFRSVFAAANTLVLPVLTTILRSIEKIAGFITSHKDFMVGAVTTLGVAIATFLVPPLIAAASAAFLTYLPFLAIASVIGIVAAAVGLLVDDFASFERGQRSVTGAIVKKWPELIPIVKGIAAAFKFLWGIIEAFFEYFASALNITEGPTKGWERFKNAVKSAVIELVKAFPVIKTIADSIGNVFSSMAHVVLNVWHAITAAVKAAVSAVTGAVDKVTHAYAAVKNALGFSSPEAKTIAHEAQQKITTANALPISHHTTQSMMNQSTAVSKNTSISVGDVNIQTQASDAKGIANGVAQHLKTQIRQGINSYDDAVVS